MVWKAIGLCTIGELDIAKAELAEKNNQLIAMGAQVLSSNNRATLAETRYDALVEKLRVQAIKPDDGIIHAKNSGDVRRIFEQQISAQEAKRDRETEN